MVGGDKTPKDSERRALIRTSRKESAKGEALKKASELRPDLSVGAPSAASRVCDERPDKCVGAPLTPRPAPLEKCRLTTPTSLEMEDRNSKIEIRNSSIESGGGSGFGKRHIWNETGMSCVLCKIEDAVSALIPFGSNGSQRLRVESRKERGNVGNGKSKLQKRAIGNE